MKSVVPSGVKWALCTLRQPSGRRNRAMQWCNANAASPLDSTDPHDKSRATGRTICSVASSQDLGSQDLGSQDLGSQDLGSQDLGSQDLGSQDLGSQDLGSQDLGRLIDEIAKQAGVAKRFIYARCGEKAELSWPRSSTVSRTAVSPNATGTAPRTTRRARADGLCRPGRDRAAARTRAGRAVIRLDHRHPAAARIAGHPCGARAGATKAAPLPCGSSSTAAGRRNAGANANFSNPWRRRPRRG
jgi:hypothetical protein